MTGREKGRQGGERETRRSGDFHCFAVLLCVQLSSVSLPISPSPCLCPHPLSPRLRIIDRSKLVCVFPQNALMPSLASFVFINS